MLRLVSKLFGTRSAPRSLDRRLRQSFRLELLEDRCVPATLFVDPNGGAFTTITDAVNAAHPGDTIKVAPGTYHEGVDVTKPLTILGGQIRVSGESGPSIVVSNPALTGFALDANNITIRNFAIEHEVDAIRSNGAFSGFHILDNQFLDDGVGVRLRTSLAATAPTTTISGNAFTSGDGTVPVKEDIFVDTSGARNVVISNNRFDSAALDASISVDAANVSTNLRVLNNAFLADAGIDIDNVTGAKIDGNFIFNPTSSAIVLDGGVSNSEVARNTIMDTQSSAPGGIVLDNVLVATIDTGNKVLSNAIHGMSVGILLNPANQTTVTGNTVVFSTADGIVLQAGSTGNTLTGNTVLDSTGNGIRLTQAPGNTLTHNVASHNQGDGIFLSGTTGAHLIGNTADFNLGDGIALSGSDHNVLTGNKTSFNHNGVSITTSSFETLTGNLAEHNSQIGFFLFSASRNSQLIHNTARANFTDGFFAVEGSDTDTYDSNVAVNNGQDGFGIQGSGSNVLTNNVASHNVGDGIFVTDGPQNLIKHNTANFNRGDGVLVVRNNGSTLVGNTADRNGADGMSVEECTNCSVTANTTLNNTNDGIDVDGSSSGNQITSNTSTGNGQTAGGFDLFDGSGTTTQNAWSKDKANTRNVPGLG
jgi:parallel beta-helix repeat protein